ncbi:MAG TPA: hypothetical protein VMR70_18255 [Flavisolibacter sp.]|nr:hypothetical protein [Flavisolibacter sp.]
MKTPAQRLENDIRKIENGILHFAPGEIREAMQVALQNAKQALANFKEIERLTGNQEGLD